MFNNANFNADGVSSEQPPKEMSSADQLFFKSKIKSMNVEFSKIKLIFSILNDYIKAEDFKDDSSHKGYQLIDSIYNLGDNYFKQHGEMLKRLKTIGDCAELILLKTDLFKDYIYVLKEDRKAISEFYDLMGIGVEDYNKIAKQVENKYSKLLQLQKNHSKMDLQHIKKENGKEQMFVDFYNLFNEFLINTRKLMRNANETGELSEFDLDNLANQEDNMRKVYNNFVD